MEFFGYEFKNESLLQVALTTPAYCNEHESVTEDNQRLEYLGDAVLCLLAAEWVFRNLPQGDEGKLTERRIHMVSTAALCAAADRMGLNEHLLCSGSTKPPKNAKVYADAVEAVIGAAYLDGGLTAAMQVFETLELSANSEGHTWSENPKGALQIYTQKLTPRRMPVYERIKVAGKAHDPLFTVRVSVEGVGEAEGTARTHREAEALAAAELLRRING